MNIKDLLPLVGVLVGWALKELSDYLRERGQDRKEVGRALMGLLQLNDELQRLKMYQEYRKDRASGWEQYERFRVQTAKRYLARTDPAQSVQSAIDVLAGHSPVDAVNVRDMAILLKLSQNLSLETVCKDDDEAYVKWLSTLETAFDVSEHILRTFILKLAWSHGPVTWLKVRLSWRRKKNELAKKNRQFLESLLDETLTMGNDPKQST